MNIFKNKNSVNAADPFITVNCDVKASISNRVDFHTQNFQILENPNSTGVIFAAQSYEIGYDNSRKGMFLDFPSDIRSGTFSPADPGFPFRQFYYFESGASTNSTTYFLYNAETGTVKVEVISNTPNESRYIIDFDVKGKDDRTEELHLQGTAKLNVFKRNL